MKEHAKYITNAEDFSRLEALLGSEERCAVEWGDVPEAMISEFQTSLAALEEQGAAFVGFELSRHPLGLRLAMRAEVPGEE